MGSGEKKFEISQTTQFMGEDNGAIPRDTDRFLGRNQSIPNALLQSTWKNVDAEQGSTSMDSLLKMENGKEENLGDVTTKPFTFETPQYFYSQGKTEWSSNYQSLFESITGFPSSSNSYANGKTTSPPSTEVTAGRGKKLKGEIIDWDRILGKPHSPVHYYNNERGFDDSYFLKDRVPSTCASYDDASDKEFSELKQKMLAIEPTAEEKQEIIKDREKMELRKNRFGDSIDPPTETLNPAGAVNMSLDEIIKNSNGVYKRTHDGAFRKQFPNVLSLMGNEHLKRRRHLMNDDATDEDLRRQVEILSTYLLHNLTKKRTVIIDGNSLAFGLKGDAKFDWEGIRLCVDKLVELDCSEVIVIVPEKRVKRRGISENEDLIENLKKGGHLRTAWENRSVKLFLLKTAKIKDAVLISNDVWKESTFKVRQDLLDLKERTIGYTFTSTKAIEFLKTPAGLTLEDLLKSA